MMDCDQQEESVRLSGPVSKEPGLSMDLDITAPAPPPRLHCPFHQNDVQKYGQCNSCNGGGFELLPRLKEHIWKYHVDPDQPMDTETSDRSKNEIDRVEKLKGQKDTEKQKEKAKKEKEERKKKNTAGNKKESRREKKKRIRCPETLSPQRYYELLETRRRAAKKDSPRSAWLEIYQSIFPDDTRSPPSPFKPYLEQLLHLVLHPSPEFLAWCEQHHQEDSSVKAKLDLIPKIVAWLGETGGFPSEPGTLKPSIVSQPGGSPASLEQSASQPSDEVIYGHGGECVMGDVDEVTGTVDTYRCDDGDEGFFADMTNDEWDSLS